MLKGKAPILVALILGSAAAALGYYQVEIHRKEATRGWQLQNVMVAASDLQPGSYLTSDSVKVSKMPRKFIYESVLVPADMEVALGREIVVPIKRGEPLHWYQLQGVRSLERLSKAVRKRGRAISMQVSERSSVGQWCAPTTTSTCSEPFATPIPTRWSPSRCYKTSSLGHWPNHQRHAGHTRRSNLSNGDVARLA
jgi:pilus assembly protein CpaB